ISALRSDKPLSGKKAATTASVRSLTNLSIFRLRSAETISKAPGCRRANHSLLNSQSSRTDGPGSSGLRAGSAADGACSSHDVTGLKAGQRFDNIESNLPHAVVRLDQQPERPVVGRSGEYHPSVIAITLFMVNTHRGFSRPKPFCRPIRHIVQDRFGQSYEV